MGQNVAEVTNFGSTNHADEIKPTTTGYQGLDVLSLFKAEAPLLNMATKENGLRNIDMPGVSSSYLQVSERGSFVVPHVETCAISGSLSHQHFGHNNQREHKIHLYAIFV